LQILEPCRIKVSNECPRDFILANLCHLRTTLAQLGKLCISKIFAKIQSFETGMRTAPLMAEHEEAEQRL